MLDPTALAQNITGAQTATGIAEGVSLTDESGNGALLMSSSARTNLMAKLHGGAFANMVNTTSDTQAQPAEAAVPQATSGCILLKNMFNPAFETDPDFDLDIREDVMDEAQKYGTLRHIYVDKTSADGRVYLKFSEPTGAQKTLQALHNRWFGQNQINATFVPADQYAAQFPDAS